MPRKSPTPVPEGMHTVTPYFTYKGNCTEAIEFYKSAFGAAVVGEIAKAPDGRIMHAMMKIGDSNIMMSDSFRDTDVMGTTLTMWMYVDDCDALFQRAAKAGCAITMPMEDAFWGDRLGQVEDPYGYRWSIASWIWELTPEEIQERQNEWLRSAKPGMSG